MSIQRVATQTISVYGDGSTTTYTIDLNSYFPYEFSVLYVYTISYVNVPYKGSFPVANVLTYNISGSILTVTLPNPPPTWVLPNVDSNNNITSTPQAESFMVTVAY
jgi:hypothetical protein